MLSWRIYRAAFLPVIVAALVMAFALESRPDPRTTTFAADAFDGTRALVELQALARRFPDRAPGSPGDDALAGVVGRQLDRAGFRVSRETFTAGTSRGRRELVNVVGVRPGVSEERTVVIAHRDALSSPATAQLSGTATLLELARVYQGRQHRRTLVLASTSAGSAGNAGTVELLGEWVRPTDIVIAVGDVAGPILHRPYVVPWSDGPGIAPLALRRTVESAVSDEVRLPLGRPGVLSQFARQAFPLAPTEQGPLLAVGVPAVLVQASGERGPGDAVEVRRPRLEAFGRAVLRAVTAIDESDQVAAAPSSGLAVTEMKVLPGWTVRLLVGTLLLPALLGAVDAAFRARRRVGPVTSWLGWSLTWSVPFLAAVGLLLVLGALGLVPAPPSIPPPDSVAVGAGTIAALVATGFLLVLGFAAARVLARVVGAIGDPGLDPRAGVAAALLVTLVAVAVWIANPFAAALLVPAVHLWLVGLCAGEHPRRAVALPLVLAGLVPPVLIGIYYGIALALGPVDLPTWLLAVVAGDALGLGWAVLWCFALGATVAALVVAVRAREPAPPPSILERRRIPLGPAGPGALGGTESALVPGGPRHPSTPR